MKPHPIHIIAFNIPWPANYGGVIDVYYKVAALHRLGLKITLHCYEYEHNERPTDELEKICHQVYYYPREQGWKANLSPLPYNVYGRKGKTLLKRLLEDEAPLLFEGLQSCYYLAHPALSHRLKIVRPANVEHHYYWSIGRAEHGFVAKAFHYIEALKFALFERKLRHADIILPVSKTDAKHYRKVFPNLRVQWIPCFHKHTEVQTLAGRGSYILYHAKLSVAENEEAALWLVEHVFSRIDAPSIIAGMNPSERLVQAIAHYEHIQLICNPSEEIMERLIADAQIHLLWTAQPTGLKLKLLNSLFAGRHVVVNDLMLVGTGLEPLCRVVHTPEEAALACQELMSIELSPEDIAARKAGLAPLYDTAEQAQNISSLLSSYI